jgi:lysophospholipase L1-like esterase
MSNSKLLFRSLALVLVSSISLASTGCGSSVDSTSQHVSSHGNVSIPSTTTTENSTTTTSRTGGAPSPKFLVVTPSSQPSTTTTTLSPTSSTSTSTTSTTTPQPVAPIHAAVFGDSLTTNSAPYIDQELDSITSPGTITPVIYDAPGKALCDFLSQMQTVATTLHPEVVAIEFGGNDFSPCTSASSQSGFPAVVNQYQNDLTTAISTFLSNGTEHIIVIGPPLPSPTFFAYPYAPYQAVKAMYASYVPSLNNPAVTYFDTSPWIDDPVTHSFTQYLPCKSIEISEGNCTGPVINGVPNNVVRFTDGAHLCAAMDTATYICQGYAPGAWRMSNAVVTAIAQAFTPAYSPKPEGP